MNFVHLFANMMECKTRKMGYLCGLRENWTRWYSRKPKWLYVNLLKLTQKLMCDTCAVFDINAFLVAGDIADAVVGGKLVFLNVVVTTFRSITLYAPKKDNFIDI